MTREELIALLTDRFAEGFAEAAAARIGSDPGTFARLYDLVASPDAALPARVRHAVAFRGAYVVATVYFTDPARFAPFARRFCRDDFRACADSSARRHFGKIMAHLLGHYDPGREALEAIAECAAEWAAEPANRPAVRIWAMEVLKRCRDRVEWIDEAWDDLTATMARDDRPSIAARLRRSWKDPGIRPGK